MMDTKGVADWYQKGLDLQKKGNYRAALACLDIALDFNPRDAQTWWSKAIALKQCGPAKFGIDKLELLRREAQCYEEALRVDPSLTPVRFNLAAIHSELNNYTEAATLIQQIVDNGQAATLEPSITRTQMYALLANTYFNLGDYAQALNVVRQARQSGIDSEELREQEEIFTRLSANAPGLTWMKPIALDLTGGPLSWQFFEVEELRDLRLLAEMQALLDDICLQYGPSAVIETLRFRETLKYQFNEPKPNIPDIPPEELTDTTPDVWFTWAHDLIAVDEFSDAQQMLLRLEIALPENICARTIQGYLFSTQGEHEQAAIFYRQAVERYPTDSEAWNGYVDCLTHLERWEDARQVSRRAVNSVSEPDRTLLLKQTHLEGMVSPSGALGVLFRLEQLFPGRDIELLQALYMTTLGRKEEALAILQELDPKWFEGILAELCRQLQSFYKIMPGKEKAVEHDPILEFNKRWRKQHAKPVKSDISVEDLLDYLSNHDVARRITDRSLLAVNEYLEWHLDQLGKEAPPPGSINMFNGLFAGNEEAWVDRILRAHNIGQINYHAARLYGEPATFARISNTMARLYYRIGAKNVSLALLCKAAMTLQDAQQPALSVFNLIKVANASSDRKLFGKAWNYLSVALPLAKKVSPALRGFLWHTAAECLSTLDRNEEAAKYYQKIADMPESAELPSLYQGTISETPHSPGRPISNSLKEDALLALEGTQAVVSGKLANVISSDYIGFRPEGPFTLEVSTPYGPQLFFVSSHHELYDGLQHQASQILTIRNSLSLRGSAADYLAGWTHLIESLIKIALRTSLPHRALEWLEAFRATTLLQRLALAAGPCPDGIDPDEWKRLEELFRRYRTVIESATETNKAETAHLGLNIEELEGAIHGLVGALRFKHPHLDHRLGVFTLRRGLPSHEAFDDLPEHTYILEYFCDIGHGGCWIIDPKDPKQPVWIALPGLNRETANLVAGNLKRALDTWKKSGRNYGTFGSLETTIDSAISFIRDIALRPVLEEHLPHDVRHLVVIPHAALSNLPFHAAVDIGSLIITYAPSLTVLASLKRSVKIPEPCGVVAANSIPDGDLTLPGAQVESRYVAHLLQTYGFKVELAIGKDVTVEWLEERISLATVLHLGIHGIFNSVRPAHSGLVVAPSLNCVLPDRSGLLPLESEISLASSDEGTLPILWTLQRIWQHTNLSRCQLAFMADCETSLIDLETAPEEFVSLSGGLLQAGVATVIGSMWELVDLPTLLCTLHFYRIWLNDGRRPSEALAQAQLWLRGLTVWQILEEEPEILMDCYRLKNGTDASSPKHALEALLGKLPLDAMPFASPFFWAPLRCVGLP